MRIYFLRHATASDIASSDDARELTREGTEESRIAGAALSRLGVGPSRILSSPLLRARQTAEIVAKALKFTGMIEQVDELKNAASTRELLAVLKPHSPEAQVLVVGHMPSLSEHIAALIGAKNPDALALGKGAVACVEVEPLRAGNGTLRWLMRQKQLGKIAE